MAAVEGASAAADAGGGNAPQLVEREGGCHCRNVRFTARMPRHVVAWRCSCSVCQMKQNHHIMVPHENFTLHSPAEGVEALTAYRFGTMTAAHYFCPTCGVVSFYQPRSNPEAYGVTLYCLDEFPEGIDYEIRDFDGRDWEKAYAATGIADVTKEGEDVPVDQKEGHT